MFKKLNHDITSVAFFIAASFFKAACFQDVIESDDGNHLLGMRYAFECAPKCTKFYCNVHSGVIHIAYVEQTGIAG